MDTVYRNKKRFVDVLNIPLAYIGSYHVEYRRDEKTCEELVRIDQNGSYDYINVTATSESCIGKLIMEYVASGHPTGLIRKNKAIAEKLWLGVMK